MEMGACKIRFAAEFDLVEPERFREMDARKVDVAEKLRVGKVADAVELRSAKIRGSGELRIPKRDFGGELGIPEICVVKNPAVETGEGCKSRFTHRDFLLANSEFSCQPWKLRTGLCTKFGVSDPLPPSAALPLKRGRITFVDFAGFSVPLVRGTARAAAQPRA